MVRWAMLGIAVVLAGCGSGSTTEPTSERQRNAAAGMTADRQVGIALFPGSRVVSSSSASGAMATGGVFQLDTNAAPGEVAAFYRDAAEAAGWTVQTNVNAGAVRFVGATKGDESLTVQVANRTGAPGSTVVVVRGAKGQANAAPGTAAAK